MVCFVIWEVFHKYHLLDQSSFPIPLKYAYRQDTQTLKNKTFDASSLSIFKMELNHQELVLWFCSTHAQLYLWLLPTNISITPLNEGWSRLPLPHFHYCTQWIHFAHGRIKGTIFMHNLIICRKLVECPINIFSTSI